MKYWLTTDTHFGHEQMIDYCGRPDDFDEIIRSHLIKSVKPDDMLIHLGDVCIGNEKRHNSFFKELGCRTVLVKGNHDGKNHAWYMNNGWTLCVDRFDMKYGGKRIAFTHIPVGWDGYFDLNIHGHLHNANHRRHEEDMKKTLNGYHRLLALEYTKYRPVLLDKFLNPKNLTEGEDLDL